MSSVTLQDVLYILKMYTNCGVKYMYKIDSYITKNKNYGVISYARYSSRSSC